MAVNLDTELIELKCLPDYGGGRGVVAKTELMPGQLLLLEQPIVTIPSIKQDEETLHLALARAILQHPQKDDVLQKLSSLHPVQLTDLSASILAQLQQEHAADVDKLIFLLGDKPTSSLRDMLLRLLLVLRFNAHPSGIYVASEMFNHACCPNAIKLATPHGSEVRVIKPVEAHSQVTISYLDPPLQSYRRRCQLLAAQHFFSPQRSCAGGYPEVMEAWSEHAAASSSEEQRESQLQKCEEELDVLEAQARLETSKLQAAVATLVAHQKQLKRKARGATKSGTGTAALEPPKPASSLDPHPQDATAQLLSRVCEVRRQAAALLHPRHIVLARIHELIILLCSTLMSAWSDMPAMTPAPVKSADVPAQNQGQSADQGEGAAAGSGIPGTAVGEASPRKTWIPQGLNIAFSDQQPDASNDSNTTASSTAGASASGVEDLALLLLTACLELRQTQELYTGPAHYDSARTLLDTQNCLEFLLSQCPRRLYKSFPKEFGNFSAASRAAHKFKTEHARIAALYQ